MNRKKVKCPPAVVGGQYVYTLHQLHVVMPDVFGDADIKFYREFNDEMSDWYIVIVPRNKKYIHMDKDIARRAFLSDSTFVKRSNPKTRTTVQYCWEFKNQPSTVLTDPKTLKSIKDDMNKT